MENTLIKKNSAHWVSWKVASLHFSNNLFDNPLLNAGKKWLWVAILAGVLAGIVIMWVGRRLVGKRANRA